MPDTSKSDTIDILHPFLEARSDSMGNMTHQDELVVKPADNYSNDVNLFEKNKGNRKRRR